MEKRSIGQNEAVEEIRYIKKIIEEGKKNIGSKGIHLIVWGILISIALVASWYFRFETKTIVGVTNEWLIWLEMIAVVTIFEIIYQWKVLQDKTVKTYTEKVDGYLWVSIGITITLIGFVGYHKGVIDASFSCPLISAILAIGYFTSGVLYKVEWVRNLALGWWTGALIMFIFPGDYHLLLMAGMMMAFQTIPGYIIHKYWIK